MGGGKKHFEMGDSFVGRLPLVPLPKVSSENSGVEDKLVSVVHDFLGRIGCGSGIGICNSVIDMTPDNLDGISGGVCLAEALVVQDPVCVGDDGIGLVEVGKQI